MYQSGVSLMPFFVGSLARLFRRVAILRRPYFRGHGDRVVRLVMLALTLALTLWTGWLVGVVSGRHEARMAKWRDCSSRIEVSGYVQAVFPANPCEGR